MGFITKVLEHIKLARLVVDPSSQDLERHYNEQKAEPFDKHVRGIATSVEV